MSLRAPRVFGADLSDRIEPRPVRHTEVILHGAVWDVRRDTVDLGAAAGEVVREYVEHTGAVAVLALRSDRGRDEVLLIQQYRHPVGVFEWEIPAGLLDVDGEPPAQAAARELGEEADLVAGEWSVLVDYVSSPGGNTEALRVYLATELSDVPDTERHEREGEEAGMPACWVDLDAVVDAVLAGRLRNSTAAIAVLAAQRCRELGWSRLRPVDAPWTSQPSGRLDA